MNLEQFSTEQLLEEQKRRDIHADEVRFKLASVDGAKWSDLTLIYSLEEFMEEKILKIAPFFKNEFCYHNLGEEVDKLLPSCLSSVEECIFEYYGEKKAEDGVKFLENLGFKMRLDNEFFGY